MTTQPAGKDETMTIPDPRDQPRVNPPTDREQPAPVTHNDQQRLTASTPIQGREPSTSPATSPATEAGHVAGDPRALLALRLLAAAALLVTALIHARLAFQLGLGGAPLGRGQLFFIQAVFSAVIAAAMFTRNNRVWLLAVVFSAAGLIAILASVYFPITAVGPFPAIDEPTWLLTKAICALAELTVIALWAIRQIAPSGLPE
jgi:hypothetical protein